MKNEKKKGGKRSGAGRRPAKVKKEAVTIYTDVSKFGGKEGARMAIYEFLDGKINPSNQKSFIPLPESTLVALHNAQNKSQFTETYNLPKKKAEAILKPNDQSEKAPVDVIRNADIEDKIQVIRAEKIPKERDTVNGRKSWQMEQQKRIQELKNQLK